MKRTVVAPWSSRESKEFYRSCTVRHIESILNHLGLTVDYFDIDASPLPDPVKANWGAKYIGMVSCFETDRLNNGERWLAWARRFSQTGLPWVMVGHFGFLGLKKENVADLLQLYGVRFTPNRQTSLTLSYIDVNASTMNYERKLADFNQYPPLFAEQATHWLRLSSKSESIDSSAVFFVRGLAVAYGNYGLFRHPDGERKQWQVNPFHFLSKGLNLNRGEPVPDVSLLNGTRVFFSHIDGDSFHSISQMDPNRYCGEIVEEKILKAYPQLPFGVSMIAAELDEKEFGNKRLIQAAKGVLSLSNVEAASHTYYHPLEWGTGKLSFPGVGRKLDLNTELVASTQFIQSIIPQKRVELLYWSGDCMPGEPAMRVLQSISLGNLNGGDGRADSDYSSVAYLSPLGRTVGTYFQVFSANANDNIYTGGWKGPFFGFRRVIETFEWTKGPPVLKPINPYFHFFAGDRKVGIESVRKVLDWAQKNQIAPVFPSDYVKSVLAFRAADIQMKSSNEFSISNAAGLMTLRLDEPHGRVPNLKRSKGILGFKRIGSSLYFHLDPNSNGKAQVFLRDLSAESHLEPPYLESVGGKVDRYRVVSNRLTIWLDRFARGPLVLAGISKQTVRVQISGRSRVLKVEGGRIELPLEWDGLPKTIVVSL